MSQHSRVHRQGSSGPSRFSSVRRLTCVTDAQVLDGELREEFGGCRGWLCFVNACLALEVCPVPCCVPPRGRSISCSVPLASSLPEEEVTCRDVVLGVAWSQWQNLGLKCRHLASWPSLLPLARTQRCPVLEVQVRVLAHGFAAPIAHWPGRVYSGQITLGLCTYR